MIGLVSYLTFFLTMAGIMAIITLGLNLHWGYTGLFNGGVVAFFGAGAYGTMILGGPSQPDQFGGFELPYLVALGGGVVIAGALAWVVGLLTLRLRHDYLAISTFGIAVALEAVARNAQWLTGGARGLRGFPRPFEDQIDNNFLFGVVFLLIVLTVLGLIWLSIERLVNSPFGRALRAIREDEVAARALGKNPVRLRLWSLVIGAAIMGAGGGLYVSYTAFVSPQDLLPILTFQIWAMLIVGGAGNNRGAVLGAVLIWGVWTLSGFALTRLAPASMQIDAGSIQYILIGTLIVCMLIWRPEGLLPEKIKKSQPMTARKAASNSTRE
ncbi:branched-chain amino acid ABC transporter permease [Ponticoccus sp. SC2-23]|uniref:branched-chain amino acid ABC transporter permease n=1 Tax=Alexandriicola marinus TaxID=2081710 RepID=UPI000FDA61BB|nr:branched-chain amino acid ABC transporter permease [Alexandriicola marinus]MBM1221375.1 branched-chain amino acid ABC transporter permease [Ponticoccus sp. SC6-9]MBM1226416.1 branched-chain amino acid ABC transporter permease [Ponticoccus sp. SC6-15]MBM1230367.1 branched-chain amino acid ABC transporter permease [Ponticoccus sp. SC6-38]MBM1234890.1 branched-chain amino acid ABC transporter permease [Ponticoccus sp. SC6-45]MBM1239388.1 branched-chain amino acid ABC transporter permease [Pont